MTRTEWHKVFETWTLSLILLTLPFRPLVLNNLCIILFALNWAASGNLKEKFQLLRQNKSVLLFLGLFMLLVVSFFLSVDKRYAWSVLERNLVLGLLPIILATSRITFSRVATACYVFCAGCLLGMIICLARAVPRYFETGEEVFLFYHELSDGIALHAVYFSFYVAFCIFFLLLQLGQNWRTRGWGYRSLHIVTVLVFYAFVIMLTSKTIIIALTVLCNMLVLYWIVRRIRAPSGVAVIVILNVLIIVGIAGVDPVRTRFLDPINFDIEFIKTDTYSELTVFTGVTIRLTMWKFIVEVLNERDRWLAGASIGDADGALHDKTVAKGLYGGNAERGWTDYTSYNAHNQFFQYLLWIGMPGVVCFDWLLVTIFLQSVRRKKVLLLLTVLLFTVFCVTESVLAVNKGIVFFSVVLPLLIYSEDRHEDHATSVLGGGAVRQEA